MDVAQAVNKIAANLPQEKINFINEAHQREVEYLKKFALDNKNKDEKKQLTDLAPLKDFLTRKYVVKEVKSVNEIICSLKNRYLSHNEE